MRLVVDEIVEAIRESIDNFDPLRAERVERGIEDERVLDDRLLPSVNPIKSKVVRLTTW